MALLSRETEQELKSEVLETVYQFLESYSKFKSKTGLITAKKLMEELDIKDKTLKRWEATGLKRYQPPLEDTRKVYYKVSDILNYLGVGK